MTAGKTAFLIKLTINKNIMKTIKLILIFLITTVSLAQGSYGNDDKRFTWSINTEPFAESNGKIAFNIGADLDYQMDKTYFKLGFYTFPDLNNVGYTQFHGGFGVNTHLDIHDNHRIYSGVIGGFNIREKNPNYIVGIEGGYQWYITDKVGIGAGISLIRRGDAVFFDGKRVVHNGKVEIIFVL